MESRDISGWGYANNMKINIHLDPSPTPPTLRPPISAPSHPEATLPLLDMGGKCCMAGLLPMSRQLCLGRNTNILIGHMGHELEYPLATQTLETILLPCFW